MRLVKLDAIDSTNDFLKDLSRRETLENFTVVSAENQTKGKGQMGAVWNSQAGKNLIMSVLVKDFLTDATAVFDLNIAASLAVIRSLENWAIPDLRIKWPNDIMSGNKKIGGILIENSFKSDQAIDSVIGIGMNVNQTEFENLPQASSLALQTGAEYDKETLLFAIVSQLEAILESWQNQQELLRNQYADLLFNKGISMTFQKLDESRFAGQIIGVDTLGRLQILSGEKQLLDFDLKQVKMLF